jgi:hypothetical protein
MNMKHVSPLKRLLALFLVGFALTAIVSIQSVRSQAGTVVSVQPQTSSAQVGETIAVNITLSNVQNLYGVDVTLNWNTSILKVVSAVSRLGVESHPGGVLHESVNVVEDSTSQAAGEYHLVATSQNPAASFNGSGTIAILTFNVTQLGHSGLDLQSELADHPLPDEVAQLIEHTDDSGSFDAIIPEFPEVFALGLLLVIVTVGLIFSKKLAKKKAA